MQDSQLPFSQAAENNTPPILEVLKLYIKPDPQKNLLEIGHGNAQHAAFMSSELKVQWYPSDMEENNWIAEARRQATQNDFLKSPLLLQVGLSSMSDQISRKFDYVYTANTLHIMSRDHAGTFCKEISTLMKNDGYLFIYGPFKFSGKYTSESNANFDGWLKERNLLSGIRDFEFICEELEKSGISLEKQYDLPANNQFLVFKKSST